MNVGDRVRLRPPWGTGEDVFNVVRVNTDGVVGIDLPGYEDPEYPGADFAPEFLELVE